MQDLFHPNSRLHAVNRRCSSVLGLMLLKEEQIPPLSLFTLFLGPGKVALKVCVNTCPVISNALGSSASQVLQHSF